MQTSGKSQTFQFLEKMGTSGEHAAQTMNGLDHSTSSTANSVQGLGTDHNYLLFLHLTDVSEISIILFQLTETKNYTYWYRSMRLALLGRIS